MWECLLTFFNIVNSPECPGIQADGGGSSICIVIVWVPCSDWQLGEWLACTGIPASRFVCHAQPVVGNPILTGLLTAGVLAAIMSLDSQFLAWARYLPMTLWSQGRGNKLSDSQKLRIARLFIVIIVALTYLLAMALKNAMFDLAICALVDFLHFSSCIFRTLWKRATKAGAIACVVSALLSWLYFFHKSGYGGSIYRSGIVPAAVCFLVSSIAMIEFTNTRPPSSSVDRFFPKHSDCESPQWRMKIPMASEVQIKRSCTICSMSMAEIIHCIFRKYGLSISKLAKEQD